MLALEGDGGAKQSRLAVGCQHDRDPPHAFPIAPFRGESARKGRTAEPIRDPVG